MRSYFALLAAMMLLVSPLAFAATGTNNTLVFPPDQSAQVCDDTTALVWNGSGNVRCEKVVKSLPKYGKPIFGAYTNNIVGVDAINKALEDGIQIAWGSFELDKEYNRTACMLPPNPTNEQLANLWENSGCAHRFCNGVFKNPVNAISVTLVGACGIGMPAGTSCYETYGKDVPVVNFGCMWMLPE